MSDILTAPISTSPSSDPENWGLYSYRLEVRPHFCRNCRTSWHHSSLYEEYRHRIHHDRSHLIPIKNPQAPLYDIKIHSHTFIRTEVPACFACLDNGGFPHDRIPYVRPDLLAWSETLERRAEKLTTNPIRIASTKRPSKPSATEEDLF